MELKTQPPQSPTFNALDCGIFNSIQKKVFHSAPCNIDDLIAAVEAQYSEIHCNTIDNVFLSVQASMRDCLAVDGNNSVPMSHIRKNCCFCRLGMLPTSLSVPNDYDSNGVSILGPPIFGGCL